MDLKNFKTFTMVSGKSFMTVSKNGVAFSQAAIAELDKAEYVKILIDTIDKQIAIKVASKEDPDSTYFLRRGKKTLYVRWNNSVLKAKISSMMGWDLNQHSYHIDSYYDSKDHLLLFDLKKAQEN